MDQNAVESLASEARHVSQAKRVIPTATYRLQMHAGFTLQQARAIVPYLKDLGISHLYVSSLLKAQPGSLHGYDVVNHGMLNPELGTEDDLAQLADELRQRSMGLILDVVPNHMRVGTENEWWMDVMESGPSSKYADFFDISWQNHPSERLHGKVLLPILDEPYGKAIRAGRFKVRYADGAFAIAIDQTHLPLDPRSYATILEPVLESFRTEHDAESVFTLELQSIISAIRHLPPRDDRDLNHIAAARAEGMVVKRRLRELGTQTLDLQQHIDRALQVINGEPNNPESFAKLIDILDAQAYRPSFWRVALDEINYRRFFDVNDLAALAAERLDVFRAVHQKPFEWLRKGYVDGLRVDHVDGLLDPQEYLNRLQREAILSHARVRFEQLSPTEQGTSWEELEPLLAQSVQNQGMTQDHPLYVVVEKILGQRESLPTKWSCHGTTGYEFLNIVNGLFVDTRHADQFTEVYQRFSGQTDQFEHIAYEKKLQILRTSMTSELNVLSHRLDKLAQADWSTRDFTLNGLRHALEEVIACFEVYRSYVVDEASPLDRNVILRATRRARALNPLLGRDLFDFIRDTLLLKDPISGTASPEYHEKQRQFAWKFQQLTAPVMAKGVEDTAFYTYCRLVSLNEVGGEPSRFGRTPEEIHTYLKTRYSTLPHGLSPLSTHDTKRGEDVRARINVLSEIPEEWERRIKYWSELNRPLKLEVDESGLAPDENEEYFLYQILVGAWQDEFATQPPSEEFIKRIQDYMTKANREAKRHSSWINPQTDYDQSVSSFIAAILDPRTASGFLEDFRKFLETMRDAGRLNSLAQTLVKCTAPGVPDTYQGTESWDDSLVDPDNRRPVDYGRRQALLNLIRSKIETGEQRVKLFDSETAKIYVTNVALQLRRRHPELFQRGDYTPLEIEGPDREHVFAFLRHTDTQAALVLVPRLVGTLNASGRQLDSELRISIDAAIRLPAEWTTQSWENLYSGEKTPSTNGTINVNAVFQRTPVGLLFASK